MKPPTNAKPPVPHFKPVPANADTWYAGWVYEWSPVFNTWLDDRLTVTVKPGDDWGTAYYRRTGQAIGDKQIFYSDL